ncbi:5257_t:CDS:10 [Paraglomus occultum]|uniref:Actin cytoskeleton-regulatory complex protein SLA1 n=1 Tax=Paraglomus occultum TaxID=144539 RepID=A0A9N8VI93_9GLOM|nr:5257_t:CDS:10 [Paraglomus occultum]
MPINYVNICIALYDYDAQNEDELSFKEDDVLYILDNDDEEWWKAKLKIPKDANGEDEEEGPIGVIPCNYVQEAECSAIVKALYDYEAQTEDELSFSEDAILYLYENDDPDWYLVKYNDQFGYAPANYLEETSLEEQAAEEDHQSEEGQPPTVQANKSVSLFQALSSAADQKNSYVDPLKLYAQQAGHQKGDASAVSVNTWAVVSAPVQQWDVTDVMDIKSDKKHVHITFGGSKAATYNFQAGSKSDAEAIVQKAKACLATVEVPTVNLDRATKTSSVVITTPHYSDRQSYAEAEDETQSQHEEYEHAEDQYQDEETGQEAEYDEQPTGEEDEADRELQAAAILYDFNADGDDELTVREGESVWVVDSSSTEWWKCRNENGEEGVVPASYVEREEEERVRREEEELARHEEEERQRKAVERRRPPVRTKQGSEDNAKKIQTPTNRALPDRPAQAQSKSKPLPSNTRTWTDRTGAFKVEAQFLRCVDGKIHLHKLNGVKIAVPIDKMSKEDIAYIEEATGKKVEDSTDNMPLAAIAVAHKSKQSAKDYDWFDFFLKADVGYEDAYRYATTFFQEKLDDSSIPDLTRELMKTLGVREDDELEQKKQEELDKGLAIKIQSEESSQPQKSTDFNKIMQIKRDEQLARELQEKENEIARSQGRAIPKAADIYGDIESILQKDDNKTPNQEAPLLFAGANGALKNNTKKARPQPTKSAPLLIDASSFTSAKGRLDEAFKAPQPKPNVTGGFDDDWAQSNFNSTINSANPPPPPPPLSYTQPQNYGSTIIHSPSFGTTMQTSQPSYAQQTNLSSMHTGTPSPLNPQSALVRQNSGMNLSFASQPNFGTTVHPTLQQQSSLIGQNSAMTPSFVPQQPINPSFAPRPSPMSMMNNPGGNMSYNNGPGGNFGSVLQPRPSGGGFGPNFGHLPHQTTTTSVTTWTNTVYSANPPGQFPSAGFGNYPHAANQFNANNQLQPAGSFPQQGHSRTRMQGHTDTINHLKT